MEILKKLSVEKSTKESPYQFVGSTEDPDREGDVIRLAGWDTSNYEKNPIVLYGHDYRNRFPVGTATVTKDEVGKRLLFDVTFSDAHEDARTVKALVDEGILKTVSVGFLAKQMNLIVNPETQQIMGREFTETELLELSIVPIPANTNAVRLALEKGLVTKDQLSAFGLADIGELLKRVDELEKAFHEHTEKFEVFSKMVREDLGKQIGPLVEPESKDNRESKQEGDYWEHMLSLTKEVAGVLQPAMEASVQREVNAIINIIQSKE